MTWTNSPFWILSHREVTVHGEDWNVYLLDDPLHDGKFRQELSSDAHDGILLLFSTSAAS